MVINNINKYKRRCIFNKRIVSMPVPSAVSFGAYKDKGITYADVRILSIDEQIKALRGRLQLFLIEQIEPTDIKAIADKEGLMFPKHFTLVVMCCIAIETLGHIAFSKKSGGEGFKKVLSKIDQIFGQKLSKDFRKDLSALLPENDLKNIDTKGDLFYSYFRNTIFHGYRGVAVFLKFNKKKVVEEYRGTLLLDPYKLWEGFKKQFEDIFSDLEGNPNSGYRKQCELYLKDLLK